VEVAYDEGSKVRRRVVMLCTERSVTSALRVASREAPRQTSELLLRRRRSTAIPSGVAVLNRSVSSTRRQATRPSVLNVANSTCQAMGVPAACREDQDQPRHSFSGREKAHE
jgi:hypothetical protein